MKLRNIYTLERNGRVVASDISVIGLFIQVKNFVTPDEMKQVPSYPTLARAIRLYQFYEFTSCLNQTFHFRNFSKNKR